MIKINVGASPKTELEALFNANEVHLSDFDANDQTIGFIANGSSWGQIYYFIECDLRECGVINKTTGELIEF